MKETMEIRKNEKLKEELDVLKTQDVIGVHVEATIDTDFLSYNILLDADKKIWLLSFESKLSDEDREDPAMSEFLDREFLIKHSIYEDSFEFRDKNSMKEVLELLKKHIEEAIYCIR